MLKLFLQFFVILLIFSKSFQLKIECRFSSTFSWYLFGNEYTCETSKFSSLEKSSVEFVNGAHLEGKSHENVKAIKFINSENLTFFPRNIHEFFPNLIIIYVEKLNISKISSVDLKAYTELESIDIRKSRISSIPGDLFKFNKKLKIVLIRENDFLDQIGEKLLEDLKELKEAYFGSNKCIDDVHADSHEEIKKLKRKFADKCRYVENSVDIKALQKLVENLQKTIKNQKETIENLKRQIAELELKNECDEKEKYSNVWFF